MGVIAWLWAGLKVIGRAIKVLDKFIHCASCPNKEGCASIGKCLRLAISDAGYDVGRPGQPDCVTPNDRGNETK